MNGYRIRQFSFPINSRAFEPSQLGSIVGSLFEVWLPFTMNGVMKHRCGNNNRETYPDLILSSRERVELKLILHCDHGKILREPPLKESAARLGHAVTEHNVESHDFALVVIYDIKVDKAACFPEVVQCKPFPILELIRARDADLVRRGGMWGRERPMVKANTGGFKIDSNFGKLSRIPHAGLQTFLASAGVWPRSPGRS